MKQIWAKDLRDQLNVNLLFEYTHLVREGDSLELASNVSFRVWIDGELFSYGPRRMAHGQAAINRYDLSAYAGKEIRLIIESRSYRVTNFYIVNQPPFVAAEIRRNGEVVATASDFTCYQNANVLQKVQRFAYQRGFTECYAYHDERVHTPVETDEMEVCRLNESDVPYPKFTELPAVAFESGRIFELENPPEYDDTYLNRRGTAHFEREEQEYRISLENDKYGFEKTGEGEESPTLQRSYCAWKLPRNATGFITFDAEVEEDANLMINYDERISPNLYTIKEKFRSDSRNEQDFKVDRSVYFRGGAVNIDVYRLHSISLLNYKLQKGKYSLMAFEPDEMQFLRMYAISGKVKISNVRLTTYENEEVKATFTCDDEDINLMFESAINSFKPNAVDVLTDCPSRERAGWLCDSYFTGRAEKLLTGKSLVERNLIRCFLDAPATGGAIPPEVFPMCYPSDNAKEGRYIPNWCMWLVVELNGYLQRSGDRELVDAMKKKVITFIDYTLKFANSDGLLEDLESWVFVEWSRANDLVKGVNYPTNMLFSTALKAVYEMYGEEKYLRIAKKMDEEIVKQSYNGQFFVDNAERDEQGVLQRNTEWTETCQYYAFYFNYASKQTHPDLFACVFEEICGYEDVSAKYPKMSRANSFIGLYLRVDYLNRIGEIEKVVRDMKDYFLSQAQDTKSFWEYKTPHASCCHAFASILCEWIFRAYLGFEGFDEKGQPKISDRRLNVSARGQIPFGDKLYTIEY